MKKNLLAGIVVLASQAIVCTSAFAVPFVQQLTNADIGFNSATGLSAPSLVQNFDSFTGNGTRTRVGSANDTIVTLQNDFAGFTYAPVGPPFGNGAQLFTRNLNGTNGLSFGSGGYISNHVNNLGTEPGGGGPTTVPMLFTFTQPLTDIAFQAAFGSTLTFTLADLSQEVFVIGNNVPSFLGFRSSVAITSLEFNQFGGNFDNLQLTFAPAAVGTPELNGAAATAPLTLAFGMFFLLSHRRRKLAIV